MYFVFVFLFSFYWQWQIWIISQDQIFIYTTLCDFNCSLFAFEFIDLRGSKLYDVVWSNARLDILNLIDYSCGLFVFEFKDLSDKISIAKLLNQNKAKWTCIVQLEHIIFFKSNDIHLNGITLLTKWYFYYDVVRSHSICWFGLIFFQ